MSAPAARSAGLYQVPSDVEAREIWRHAIALSGLDDLRLSMRRAFLEEVDGCAQTIHWTDGSITVVFDLRLDRQGLLDAVLHEITHLWRLEQGCDDWDGHGDAFWVLMGSLYRAWHRET